MKKLLVSLAIGAALIVPFAASADTLSDLQAQLQSLLSQVANVQSQIATLRANATTTPGMGWGGQGMATSTRPFCRIFSHILGQGSTDAVTNGEVTSLQHILAQDPTIYPQGLVTGFFGSATGEALGRLQQQWGIVGNATTTGWGLFGPRTRDFLTQWCNGTLPWPGMGMGNMWPGTGDHWPGIGTSTIPAGALPMIAITPSSLVSTTLTPTLSGTAQNLISVMIVIRNSGGIVYENDNVVVTNNAWSVTTTAFATGGTYAVVVRAQGGGAIATGILNLTSGTSNANTNTTTDTTTTNTGSTLTLPPPPPMAASVVMRANGSEAGAAIGSGGSALIGWSSLNTTSCTIASTPASTLNGSVDLSGFGKATGALTATTVFTVTCVAKAGGTVSDSVTVTVAAGTTTGGFTGFFSGGYTGGACTTDVMQCPDGHYVSRTGPMCTFASCTLGY